MSYKQELEQINNWKLQGSIARSKVQWAEHGDKNSKFFLSLEKHNYENKLITKLDVNGKVIQGQKDIQSEIKSFY